jgi:hypothetical protein
LVRSGQTKTLSQTTTPSTSEQVNASISIDKPSTTIATIISVSDSTDNNNNKNKIALIGGIAGGVIALLLIAALVCVVVRNRRRKETNKEQRSNSTSPSTPPSPLALYDRVPDTQNQYVSISTISNRDNEYDVGNIAINANANHELRGAQ